MIPPQFFILTFKILLFKFNFNLRKYLEKENPDLTAVHSSEISSDKVQCWNWEKLMEAVLRGSPVTHMNKPPANASSFTALVEIVFIAEFWGFNFSSLKEIWACCDKFF